MVFLPFFSLAVGVEVERRLGGGGEASSRARRSGSRMVLKDQRRREEVKVGWRRMDRSGQGRVNAGVGERRSQ